MTTHNIDTSYLEFSNNEVYFSIKYLIKKDRGIYEPYQRILLISHLLFYITNDYLLNNTVRLLRESGFMANLNRVNTILCENHLNNLIYSEKDCNRIRAFVYAPMLAHEILVRRHLKDFEENLPEFRFEVNDRNVSNNVDELTEKLKKQGTLGIVDRISTIVDKSKRANQIDKVIFDFANMDFERDSDTFKKEIAYLKLIRDHIPDRIEDAPIYPFTKIGVQSRFIEYVNNHISEVVPDYSYLYARLRKLKLIEDMKHIPFIEWLKSMGYVKDPDYKKLIDGGQLRCLSKSNANYRVNAFNKVFSAFL